MNKKRIEGNIMKAYELIEKAGILEKDGSLQRTYRGYISTFGAAVTMGSLKAAITFYSEPGEAKGQRDCLMRIICALVMKEEYCKMEKTSLLNYVDNAKDKRAAKDEICDAAIAVKLAMNMFKLV